MIEIRRIRFEVRVALATLAVLTLAAGASGADILFVTIPPQKWLVERLAGTGVRVETMVRAGQNPHTFEPVGRQLAMVARADGWVTIGMPFEQALLRKVKAANKGLKEFKSHRGVARLECDHEHDGDGGMGGGDPHIWLSAANMALMATNVCRDLQAIWPEREAELERRLDVAVTEILALRGKVAEMLTPLRGRTFWVYHPSWAYFAEDYGLHQRAVEESGREPALRQMSRLVADAKREQVRV